MNQDQVSWPSAFVAVALLAMLTSITIAGIARYQVDDALKIWTAMTALVGVVTGAFVTYFFTRGPLKDAREDAAISRGALNVITGKLQPEQFNELVGSEPVVARALRVQ